MPFEVYTGSRPGRPRAALLISAGLLAATLGLAWYQSHESRALGPEQQVGNLPLFVRPPKGWIVDPNEPTAFIVPVQVKGSRRNLGFERRIRFGFEQLPAYFPVRDLLHRAGLDNPRTLASLHRARIGRYEAVEVQHEVPIAISPFQRRTRARIVRLTCLPNGIVLLVEYDALIDVRPADLQIMDEVCRTVRIDEPSVTQESSAYLDRAGADLKLGEGWLAVGNKFPEVPGVYVGGSIDGWPAWSIGIFRSWLALGRTVDDLLIDFAAQEWFDLNIDQTAIKRSERSDGAQIASLVHPHIGRADVAIVAAWVVSQSASETAILFVRSDIRNAGAANEIAGRIAGNLRLNPLEPFSQLDEAIPAGRKLADKLAERGALPRWGRAETRSVSQGNTPRGPVRITARRSPVGTDASSGYSGRTTIDLRAGDRKIETNIWTLGPHARTYTLHDRFFRGNAEVRIDEQRETPDGKVTRDVEVDRQPSQHWSFEPSDAFIAPPAEEIVTWWVAYGDGSPPLAVCQFSNPATPGAGSVLIRQLPAQTDRWRVLQQRDFWPLGIIETYDQSDEPLAEEGPSWSFQRVVPPASDSSPANPTLSPTRVGP